MYELTTIQQEQINGGGTVLAYLIYVLLGAAVFKIWQSKKGRIALPRLIQVEWKL